MLTPVYQVTAQQTPLKGRDFNYEIILSLEMIRYHTKTEDIISVTDQQILLYRRAALETAEKYTGLMLTGQKVVTETVDLPQNVYDHWSSSQRKDFFYHNTKYLFAQPFAYLYGHKSASAETVRVEVGTSRVRLPNNTTDFGLGCCNPCSANNQGTRLQYTAGYSCEADIPAAVSLGALKYIAHVMENAGDSVRRSSNSASSITAALEANNPALASGAIDIWRTIRDDAI